MPNYFAIIFSIAVSSHYSAQLHPKFQRQRFFLTRKVKIENPTYHCPSGNRCLWS